MSINKPPRKHVTRKIMTECFNVTVEPFPRIVDFKNSVYKGSNMFNFVIGWYKTTKINKETRECGFVVNRCSKHVIIIHHDVQKIKYTFVVDVFQKTQSFISIFKIGENIIDISAVK